MKTNFNRTKSFLNNQKKTIFILMKYAAIDIGTNAARLLIGEVVEGENPHIKKHAYTRVPLRLGFDVFSDGIIPESKVKAFTKSIKAFKLLAELYEVESIRACATSAMREAKNSQEIKEFIKKETAIDIEIIDGEEEANLIFSTFFLLAVDKESSFVVIDVGGGSTEINYFNEGKKTARKSFQIGTIRLLKNQVDASALKEVKEWVDQNIDLEKDFKVFATGGNINKAHKILGKLKSQPIEFRELRDFKEEVQSTSTEKLMDKYELKLDRADVLPYACEIFFKAAKYLGKAELYVPKIGLSDGIIYNQYLDRD